MIQKQLFGGILVSLLGFNAIAIAAPSSDPSTLTYYIKDANGAITGNASNAAPQTINSLFNDKYAADGKVYAINLKNSTFDLYANDAKGTDITLDLTSQNLSPKAYGISYVADSASSAIDKSFTLKSGYLNINIKQNTGDRAVANNQSNIDTRVKGIEVSKSSGTNPTITLGDNNSINITNTVGKITTAADRTTGISSSNIINGISSYSTLQTFVGNNTKINIQNQSANLTTSGSISSLRTENDITGIYRTTIANNTSINILNRDGNIVFDTVTDAFSVRNNITGIENVSCGDNLTIKAASIGGTISGNSLTKSISATTEVIGIDGNASSVGNNSHIEVYAKGSDIVGTLNGTTSTMAAAIAGRSTLLMGSVYAQAVAEGVRAADGYSAYSVYGNGYSSININANNNTDKAYIANSTVQLIGDLFTNRTRLYITMDTAQSYLMGTIIQDGAKNHNVAAEAYRGQVHLTLDNGAKWLLANNSKQSAAEGGKYIITLDEQPATGIGGSYTAKYKNAIEVFSLKVGKDVLIDLTSDGATRQFTSAADNNYRTLYSNYGYLPTEYDTAVGGFTITGSNNTFVLNSDVAQDIADKIEVHSTVAGQNYIGINYDPSFDNGTLETVNGVAKVVKYANTSTTDSKDATFVGKVFETALEKFRPKVYQGVDIPGLSGDDLADWYLTGFEKLGPSNITEDTKKAAMLNMSMVNSLIMNSDLTKRLGEIRYNPDNAGVWARIYTGENSISAVGSQAYTSVQGGIDRRIQTKRGNHFRGIAFEQLSTNSHFDEHGSGEGTASVLSLYDAWAGSNNTYHDLVFKAAYMRNKLDSISLNGELVNGNYSNMMFGVSYEYGWRKDLKNDFYYQPEIQLSYAHITGASYTTSNGINVTQQAGNSLVGRIGVTFGKKLKDNSQIFVTANLAREFLGNTSVYNTYGTQSQRLSDTLRSNWLELVVGYNGRINKKTDIYTQISKTFGGKVQRKWQIEGGFRWNW